MSVIVEFTVAAGEFELGRVFEVMKDARIELESMVPLGDRAVPFFWVYDSLDDDTRTHIRTHAAVDRLFEVDVFKNRTLFALQWKTQTDEILQGIVRQDGQLLSATGRWDEWEFEVRFPTHDALSAFKDYCEDEDLTLEVTRVYNPSRAGAGKWFGLTSRQRETMMLAVSMGYYDIPRGCTTQEVADRLGISDQAVTERLRRGIATMVSNTLLDEAAMGE